MLTLIRWHSCHWPWSVNSSTCPSVHLYTYIMSYSKHQWKSYTASTRMQYQVSIWDMWYIIHRHRTYIKLIKTHNRYQLNIEPFQLINNFISLICVICRLHRYRTHIKLVHNTILTTLSSRHTWYQILHVYWYQTYRIDTPYKDLLKWREVNPLTTWVDINLTSFY